MHDKTKQETQCSIDPTGNLCVFLLPRITVITRTIVVVDVVPFRSKFRPDHDVVSGESCSGNSFVVFLPVSRIDLLHRCEAHCVYWTPVMRNEGLSQPAVVFEFVLVVVVW
jgi:hypothetical protein